MKNFYPKEVYFFSLVSSFLNLLESRNCMEVSKICTNKILNVQDFVEFSQI
uniref:Uncharacterized protein n=1 Tax=Rhizophora mucronata TaxID=61149 RepID=A0A2P2P586_RHIMU